MEAIGSATWRLRFFAFFFATGGESCDHCAPMRRVAHEVDLRGLAFAVAAYSWWGLGPIYFKAVRHVAPLEILAHRVIWSFVALLILVSLRRRWDALRSAIRHRPTLLILFATSAIVSSNWFIFIWAITHDRVLEASLGYFINPLVNVLLGFVVLKERLTPTEWFAVAIAAAGVAWLTATSGVVPWISLALAVTFALYGLLRKIARVDSLEGLTIETGTVLAVAAGYLALLELRGEAAFLSVSAATDVLLLLAGVVTATPLIWFAIAVKRLKLATIGILQYISPTFQFALAVFAYGEPFDRTRFFAFAVIWISLAMYTGDNLKRGWRSRNRPAPGLAAGDGPPTSSV